MWENEFGLFLQNLSPFFQDLKKIERRGGVHGGLMDKNHTSDRFCPQKDPTPKRKCTKKHIYFLKSFPLAMTMRCCYHSYVQIDIKLFLSVCVFKYTPLGVFVTKNKILPKPEVSHKKMKIALETAFKLH